MKKILLAAVALLVLAQPAMAKDEGLYIAGGIIGGLLLGDVLHHHHHRRERVSRVYVEPEPREYCETRWKQEYNRAFDEWEDVPYTVCWRRY